jgi:hypothetical protein
VVQELKVRAATALKLIQAAIRDDDQDCFDFLLETVDRERLYRCFQSDAGDPITNMKEFVNDLHIDAGPSKSGSNISATAAGGSPFATRAGEERYRQRMAQSAHLRA